MYLHYNSIFMDKTQITVRLSDQTLTNLDEISNYYGVDRTAAITIAAAEWANVLRERERLRAAEKPPATAGR